MLTELVVLPAPLVPTIKRRGPPKGQGGRPRGKRWTAADLLRVRREIAEETLLEMSEACYANYGRFGRG